MGVSNTQRKGGTPSLGNLGFTEILVIMVAALVIFGPKKLPELGRSLGQGIREFKKATQAITEEVTKAAMDDTVAESKPTVAAKAAEEGPKG